MALEIRLRAFAFDISLQRTDAAGAVEHECARYTMPRTYSGRGDGSLVTVYSAVNHTLPVLPGVL